MNRILIALLLFSLEAVPATPKGTRLKDLAALEGVRDNQLVGYGLVVGLNGTGDRRQTIFSAQTLANMLERMGVAVNPNVIQVRNMAAVMVTATLPPFAQPGSRIDVTVAAVGDATNLQGGLLLITPLKAPDGQVFAAAQGSVVTGGFVAGRGGNAQTMNHPTAGRIPMGAIVEQAAPSLRPGPSLRYQLQHPDFTTAARVAEAINRKFPDSAQPESSGVIVVSTPQHFLNRPVDFVAQLESLSVESDHRSRIIVNERSGTIVMGKDVPIGPVAILHGSLGVEIQTRLRVSQPAPLSKGQTTAVPDVSVGVREDKARNVVLQDGATVEDLVRALNAIGSTPRDVIAILQNLRSAGALDADVEVI